MAWTTQLAFESSVVDRGCTRTLSCLRRIRVGEAEQESKEGDAEANRGNNLIYMIGPSGG